MNDKKSNPAMKEHTPKITAYLHCAKCIEERPSGISPKDWARTQAGFTEKGIQVWCNRHDVSILHVDFDGKQLHGSFEEDGEI